MKLLHYRLLLLLLLLGKAPWRNLLHAKLSWVPRKHDRQ